MVRDRNAPKRPLSGYFRFIGTIRAEVEEESGLNGIKVSPLLAARWNALSDDEKAVFSAKYHKEMVSHKKKMAAYKKTASYKEFLAKKKAKKFGKRPKDKNAPKRPSTAFFCFANEVREEVTADLGDAASIGAVGKKLGQLWGELSEEEKETYVEESAELKGKYTIARAKYQRSSKYAEYQEKLAEWKQAKKAALRAQKTEAKKTIKKVKK